jgi:hypothetical protein
MKQHIISPIFHSQGKNTSHNMHQYVYLRKQSLLSDATVVVGDVSDETSILNAAFLNKKVTKRILPIIHTSDLMNRLKLHWCLREQEMSVATIYPHH